MPLLSYVEAMHVPKLPGNAQKQQLLFKLLYACEYREGTQKEALKKGQYPLRVFEEATSNVDQCHAVWSTGSACV